MEEERQVVKSDIVGERSKCLKVRMDEKKIHELQRV